MKAAQPKVVSISPAEVDEFGPLSIWREQNAAKIDRFEALKKKFRKQAEDLPGDQLVEVSGKLYTVRLSARKEERVITNQQGAWDALKKTIGIAKLIKAVTITFKLLDAHVDEEQQKPFVQKDFTGSRDIAVFPKAAAKAA